MITTMFYIGATIIVVYITIFCAKMKAVPASVSETYYLVRIPAIFSVIIAASAVLVIPKLFEAAPDGYEFLAFFFGGAQLFIAAAPNFDEFGLQKKVHTAAAIVLMIVSFFYTGFKCGYLHLIWLGYIAGIACHTINGMRKKIPFSQAFFKTKPMFWAEVVVLLTMFISAIC